METKVSSAARRNRDCGARRHRRPGAPAQRMTSVPNLSLIRPVPRTQLTPGRVLWAHVDYRDGEDFKIRPVVVVSSLPGALLVRRCSTSAGAAARWNAVPVTDLAGAGLPRDCVLTGEVIRIELTDVISVAGELSTADHEAAFGAAQVAA